MQTVAVLDYGMSNLRSVTKALEYVASPGDRILATADPALLRDADRVVFPGQGAMGQCMRNLAALGLREAVDECIRTRPYLGICLGLQCLLDSSEENGGTPGLGLVPGSVRRFDAPQPAAGGIRYKIPHMGWNQVNQRTAHPLWEGIGDGERFYFVHSYYVVPAQSPLIAADTVYSVEFASAVAAGNLFAVQFHPEKSQHAGLTLLRNFLAWQP